MYIRTRYRERSKAPKEARATELVNARRDETELEALLTETVEQHADLAII